MHWRASKAVVKITMTLEGETGRTETEEEEETEGARKTLRHAWGNEGGSPLLKMMQII